MSAVRQTHAPAEILIVDDGSIDETQELYATFPPPVRVIYQKHAGVSAARNRGIQEAQGEFVAFLDSDDIWQPTKLEVQLTALESFPEVGWSLTDCTIIDLQGLPRKGVQGFARGFPLFSEFGVVPADFFGTALQRRQVEAAGERHVVYTGDAFELLFLGNFASPCAFIARRQLLKRVGGFDESFLVAQDTEYFPRMAVAAPVGIVMTPLLQWRVGHAHSNTSPRNTAQLIQNALTSLDRASRLRTPLSASALEAYRTGKRRLMLRLAYAQLAELDRTGARRALRGARRVGASRSWKFLGIYAGTRLPRWALSILATVKRTLRVLVKR